MDIIHKYRDVALSNQEIEKLVNGKANIIVYPELSKYNNLDEIFYPYDICFILYETKLHYGHWCVIFKLNDKEIEFFDPYGGYPDTQLKFIPENFRIISNQDIPHLSYLMFFSPYELSYNQYRFQKYRKDIKTCGRWCSVRALFRRLSLEEFKDLFNDNNGDDLVTLLTMYVNI